MSKSTTDHPRLSIEDLDVVVDADSHVIEGFEDYLPYMENEYHRNQIENAILPHSTVYSYNVATPPYPDILAPNEEYDAIGIPPCVTPEQKLSKLDEFGIDYGQLNPTNTAVIPSVNNDQFAVSIAQAYNSWLLDNMLDESDRLRGNLLVAPQKPAKAAEEIDRRANEDGITGIQLPGSGLVPPPGHEWYDPIYQAAEDHDLPVCMHTVANVSNIAFPIQYYWNETTAEDHAIVHPFYHMWNLTTLLFRGVPERFDIDFVFQEGGIAWIGYMLWRLDDHYLELSHEIPHLEKLPSEYVADQFYFTSQPIGHSASNPHLLSAAVEMAGPENIMFSADLPHPDFDTPEELFNRINGSFDEKTMRGIMGETAVELFR